MQPSFEDMTTAERILYVQELWDRIAEDTAGEPLTAGRRTEVRRRLAEHDADPSSAVPWEQALQRARQR